MSNGEVVVLVPGMFSPRLTLLPMARRLQKHGYQTKLFSNRYLSQSPVQNAQRLTQWLCSLPGDTIHLVGHSLGGVVIMHALTMNATNSPADRFANGKVVLIATPVQGSEFARLLQRKPALRWMLGRCTDQGGVSQASPQQVFGRDVGVIAGSSPKGVAATVYKPDETYDGLVRLSETELSACKDRVCIPQSHASMLFSSLCSELTLRFLRRSAFVAQ